MIDDPIQSSRVLVRFVRNEVALRRSAGLSQRDLAHRAGLHRSAISLIERYQRMPRLGTIVRISGAVESDQWELLHGLKWDLGPELDWWRPSAEPCDRQVSAGPRVIVASPAPRFGLLLARQRLREDLTQVDVARICQMHSSEVSKIERGEREPWLDSLLQLAAAVKIAPGDLLGGVHWLPGSSPFVAGYRARSRTVWAAA
ncbi:MAG TPA: helix-turn-helix transcriptional regulator [Solirubrobacterales bacterium]|jgi:transcriptional regulator with XRE-family HTH domain|nr:helix-turn-helix transcriptional regulator [Solirubrobacterales bacterium]